MLGGHALIQLHLMIKVRHGDGLKLLNVRQDLLSKLVVEGTKDLRSLTE